MDLSIHAKLCAVLFKLPLKILVLLINSNLMSVIRSVIILANSIRYCGWHFDEIIGLHRGVVYKTAHGL